MTLPARHRRVRLAVAAAVIVLGGVVLGRVALDGGGSTGPGAEPGVPPATTEVSRGTLTDRQVEPGELGYGVERAVSVRGSGTITWLPREGSIIRPGHTLYELDARPVTLMRGRVPAWRDLAEGSSGADVRQLETNLAAMGYDGFEVDEDYTTATAEVVGQWQDDLGTPVSGKVAAADVAFLPGQVRVASMPVGVGGLVSPGQVVMQLTGTAPAVTVELDPADRRMAREGADVEIALPDGSALDGRITETRTEISAADPADPASEVSTTVIVVARVIGEDGRRAAGRYDAATVDVTFEAGRRPGVLMVPVAALVALREGGYGVEVVSGGRSEYVPVEVGLFSAGMVEVSGSDIQEGTVVGVPA